MIRNGIATNVCDTTTAVVVNGDGSAAPADDPTSGVLPMLVGGANGTVLNPGDTNFINGVNAAKSNQLARVDLFSILCVPGERTPTIQGFSSSAGIAGHS